MKKFASVVAVAVLMMSGTAVFAQTGDAMSNDAMSNDAMSKDAMAHDSMAKPAKKAKHHSHKKHGDATGMKHESEGAMSN
ncbi:hypothetical protein WJ95_05775 [Burkholderia ubonensis]|uniref:hypothetical protein n=1 Tax=Burkholderia ubonensis TaxID=101571 RepID=UPI0007599939|nr:hypothetical protein [Burkholderia ubonensis]KVP93110.1 hypothetical protein WJ95_05775 [Burkholderia ubonensis]